MLENKEISDLRDVALSALEDVLITFGATESLDLFSDTPIRITVWRAFADDPDLPRSLIIETNAHMRAGLAVASLRRSLSVKRKNSLVSIGSIVRVSANLDEMVTEILPCTIWFRELSKDAVANWRKALDEIAATKDLRGMRQVLAKSPTKSLWRFLAAWIVIQSADSAAKKGADAKSSPTGARLDPGERTRWSVMTESCETLLSTTSGRLLEQNNAALAEKTHQVAVAFFRNVLKNYAKDLDNLQKAHAEAGRPETAPVKSIDLNRRAELACDESRKTIKVDAAENVFGISTKSITWAVIDSGIDATHPAFEDRDAPDDAAKPNAGDDTETTGDTRLARSRVVATYDFNRLQKFLENDYPGLLPGTQIKLARKLIDKSGKDRPQDEDDAVLMFLYGMNSPRGQGVLSGADLINKLKDKSFRTEVKDYVGDVKRRITEGETLDWPLLEPILRVPHLSDTYYMPVNGHGTHVAGILGGRLEPDSLPDGQGPDRLVSGMCPQIRLYDLRVCDENGQSDEFLVMAALQFIGYLNRTKEWPIVHGANLSLQIQHKVRSYGCGQTPVCREADKLVDSGVCVVVAAGNHGFNTVRTQDSLVDSYAWSSIMDPGNAAKVITVGSTHRSGPHTYGVSYFSSRGPTGDGREKPDLVAPGEKIFGPAPGQSLRTDSGTSMAAPHVSGAAAVLMARYPEFRGRPLEIKDILCRTATDLGRRKEFQGHGLVNALRALESI